MREIIFRGKTVDEKEWIYGDIFHRETYPKITRIHDYIEAEPVKLCEKCGELIQQAAKCYGIGIIPYTADMVEEMADVKVMLMQFESIMHQPDRDLLDKIITEKLERQLERIANED